MKRSTLFASIAMAAALSGIAATRANAESSILHAYEDAEAPTHFELNFPSLGITSSSNVFYTRYNLEIDEAEGTARFLEYTQEIDPLMLPLGISTGRIKVRIISSDGTYDAKTQTFQTNDIYEISFTNDLSGFGFESPVQLAAVSSGTLSDKVSRAKSVEMNWQGDGELQNEENPQEPYKFTYTCSSKTTIADSAASVPPLPTRSACAEGLMSVFGFASMGLMFAGLRVSVRRMRR